MKSVSPDAKVIIFSTPTPVSVWEPIHLQELLSGQSSDPTKVTAVPQPVEGQFRDTKATD